MTFSVTQIKIIVILENSHFSFSILADLQQLCKKLHDKICVLEEEVFDWEVKIRKQDFEVSHNTTNLSVNIEVFLGKTLCETFTHIRRDF